MPVAFSEYRLPCDLSIAATIKRDGIPLYTDCRYRFFFINPICRSRQYKIDFSFIVSVYDLPKRGSVISRAEKQHPYRLYCKKQLPKA